MKSSRNRLITNVKASSRPRPHNPVEFFAVRAKGRAIRRSVSKAR
ncbi:hypothetical protein EOD12_28595 [Mesorhizobium sp. M7A.T.Ca.TU.009.02.1.1]|nr:hypothetical protein EOD14_12450 [Mesorhizobium sp. M7A.T.Ca.US.000.02.1.1]RUT89917.1 hypothetical protein EOD15_20670 [Mesorhizobium sp. M7A.T.Ca.US.000.02.2.1]RUT96987.1 hypothetical protein EOD12_28595 [Mesorhizobium sp. M7A.T.Ca.TU.009.02.1.1]RUU51326.1 hypothetical protein EOC99_33825 [Mesorhizobium sp. M7A.T.Ca.TU.009.01.1.1]RUU89227.1 hypothetical protein EOD03_03525 [Mesorhizobium sp. M7A.T.Ca.TU.009.01.1.2]